MTSRWNVWRRPGRSMLLVVALVALAVGPSLGLTTASAAGAAPSVELVSPAAGAVLAPGAVPISGTASDDVGVTLVEVAVKDRASGQWWNGSSWQAALVWAAASLTSPGSPATDFTSTFTGAQPGHSYWLQVRAQDAAGTRSATVGRRFDVVAMTNDATAPQVTGLLPAELSVQPLGPVGVTGSAADDVAVAATEVAVKDRATGQWWNGTGWQASLKWLAAPSASPGAPRTDFSYTFTGAQGGGSYWLQARATDTSGNTAATVIRRFTTSSVAGTVPSFQRTVLGAGLADMYPVDVRAANGRYYVVDPGRYRVVAVDAGSGQIVAQAGGEQGSGPGQLSAARALSSDAAGTIYVADSANNRIQVYDAGLGYLRSWGRFGSGNGQFQTVYGVAAGPGLLADGRSGDVVYTSDADRVQKFTTSGEFIGVFATGLKAPRGMSIRPGTTELFVVNARNREVLVFNAAGSLQRRFGSAGSGPGQFSGDPRGLSFTQDGATVFVTDAGNRRIEAFDAATGAFRYEITGLVDPRGTTVLNGKLVVCDAWDYSLKEFDLSQSTPQLVRRLFGQPAPVAGVNSPRGLALDSAGNLYVSDWWNQRIVRADTSGSVTAWGRRGVRTKLGALNFAWDVAVQPGTGRVFVANRESHEIEVFEADGTPVTGWGSRGTANDPTGDFQFPNAVAFAPDGTLWVLDSDNHRVQRFAIAANGTGTRLSSFGRQGTGPGEFTTPTGLAVAADGSVWIADQGNGNLQQLDPVAGTWRVIGNPGLNRFSPRGVAIAADGSIWATDAAEQRLVKLTPQGTLVFAVTGADLGAGSLYEPFDLALGASGELYLSDLWHNRVIQLRR